MTKLIRLFTLATVLLSVPLTQTGCGTPVSKTTQAVGSVTITVEGAMKSWGAWVRARKATMEQRLAVRSAYLKYQAAMATAEKVAISTITHPEGQAAYITALNVASQSSVEVIALIEQFKKPK